ncbi:alpha/beta hydrolase family protein [Paracidovorax konjaci]|nr:alpha/beta hydrolase [Paracidovorax konjaci]
MARTHRLRALLLAAACLAAGLCQAAGFQFIRVPAGTDGPALRGAVWSPCAAPPGPIPLGPITLQGTENCPVAGQRLPLILLSHGSGGSFLGHHDTAAALADAGFVVAAINHPGDHFQDLGRQGHLSAFATRPADLRRSLDYLLGGWPGRGVLDAGRVGVFGFSRGGYTALVAAGAVPDWTQARRLCAPGSAVPLCGELRRREWPQPPVRDPRVRAVVAADPLNLFGAEGLKAVSVPLQLWASAHGGDGVEPADVAALRRALPVAVEWHRVAGAGHFAFLAPCPAAMAEAAPDLCRDAPGFDRVAFHADFNAQVAGFFQRALAGAPGPR